MCLSREAQKFQTKLKTATLRTKSHFVFQIHPRLLGESIGRHFFDNRRADSGLYNPFLLRTGFKSRQSLLTVTLRRLDGFLIEDQGEEYKVAFVENGGVVFYYLPSSLLRKAGITAAPNQPFQMDELEVELPNGRNAIAYSVVPLAKPSDAFRDPIEMNEERRRKLTAIFKRFGPKD